VQYDAARIVLWNLLGRAATRGGHWPYCMGHDRASDTWGDGMRSLTTNRADLDALCVEVSTARMAEGDTAGEVGEHLRGAVTDLILPVVAGDLLALDLVNEVLSLVRWGEVAQKYMDRIEGIDRWKI